MKTQHCRGPYHKWTLSERAILTDLWSLDYSAKQIAAILDMNHHKVTGYANNLRIGGAPLVKRKEQKFVGHWTDSLEAQLVSLRTAGWSCIKIAAELGRGQGAVRMRCQKLRREGRLP